jgi:pimeloyl-ACP methyl ester carboxylesterase
MAFTDVVVLLPGILGSVLAKGTKEVWSLGAGALFRTLTSFGRSIEALTLDHDSMDDAVDDVVATKLLPDTTILPGFWRIDGYTHIAAMLKSRFGLVEQQNYFEFAYDWRRDNRVAARKLSERVPAWLENHRRRTNNPNAKVWFLGHSMGGLVARYYLEKLGGRPLARGLVTFGTPFRGSMNALDVLVNGFKKEIGPITLVDLTTMVRSFTSVYQLLPTYTCVDDGGTLKHLTDLPQVPHLDPARLKGAREFYREMDTAAAEAKGSEPSYRLFPFVGFHQVTNLSARITDAGAAMVTTLGDQDFQGDSTVPRLSATPDEWSNAGLERYATERHASLQNAPDVLQQIEGILTDANVASFRVWAEHSPTPNRFRWGMAAPERIGLSLTIGDVVATGAALDILCRPVRPIGAGDTGSEPASNSVDLTAYVVHLGSNHTEVVPLAASPDGWHRGLAHAADPGAYRVTVVGGAGVTPVSDVFAAYTPPGAPSSVSVPEGFVRWSDVHLFEDANASIASVADTVRRLPDEAGIVLRAYDRRYAVRASELRSSFKNRDPGLSLLQALDLHENQRSKVVGPGAEVAATAPLRAALPPPTSPWQGRFVLADNDRPLAIGEARASIDTNMRGDPSNKRSIGAGAALSRREDTVERTARVCTRGLLAPGELVSIDVDLVLPKTKGDPNALVVPMAA